MNAESAKHFLHRNSKVLVTRSKSSNTEMFVMASVFTLEDALKIVVGTVRTEPRANVISMFKIITIRVHQFNLNSSDNTIIVCVVRSS